MADDRTGSRPWLPSLTSLRWFAALAVFFSHVQGTLWEQPGWFGRASEPGATGVSFFFVLSGFVMVWSFRPGTAAADFYRRRLARIYPAYALVALVSVPMIVAFGEVHSFEHVVEAFLPLTLLQSWVPHYRIVFAGNGVSWSLSTEVFFYAVFPLLIGPVMAAGRRAKVGLLVACVALPPLVALVLWPTDMLGARQQILFSNPLVRLPEFVVGMLVAALFVEGVRVPRLRVGPAAALAVAAMVVAVWVPLPFRFVSITLAPFALLILAAAQADAEDRTPALLKSPVLIKLGTWSYAFYLVHQMVLRALGELGQQTPALAVALGLAAMAGSITVSWLIYTYVEHPMERLLRGPGRLRLRRTEAMT